MVDSILLHTNTANCAEDSDTFFLTLSCLGHSTITNDASTTEASPLTSNDDSTNWVTSDIPMSEENVKENIIFYISGYVAKKLSEKVRV